MVHFEADVRHPSVADEHYAGSKCTFEVEDGGNWTLTVLGKGRKTRAIPLPAICVSVLRAYRELHGLSPQPPLFEHAALTHGLKGGSLKLGPV